MARGACDGEGLGGGLQGGGQGSGVGGRGPAWRVGGRGLEDLGNSGLYVQGQVDGVVEVFLIVEAAVLLGLILEVAVPAVALGDFGVFGPGEDFGERGGGAEV